MKHFLAICFGLLLVTFVQAQSQTIPRVSGVVRPTTGTPSNSTGTNGDFAFDGATKKIYQKTSGSWDAGTILGGGVTDGQQIFDGSHVLATDFGLRELTVGPTIVCDWSGGVSTTFYPAGGFPITVMDTGHLLGVRAIETGTGAEISYNAVAGHWVLSEASIVTILSTVDHQASVQSDDRQLIANDGSTPALDWSDPTKLVVNVPIQGPGTVIAGTKTDTGTATTTFTVTIGSTMANSSYKVTTEGSNALSAAVHYVNNKTTTTFDVVYLAGLTGSVAFDWMVSP